MIRKRPESKVSFRSFIFSGRVEKFVPLILLLLVAVTSGDIFRPLWFDEALTILNFALLDSPGKIYNSYIIPNNQIVHTIFLHWWIKLFSFDFLRLFPLLCGLFSAIMLWQMRRKNGRVATFIAIAAFVSSFPFAIYGSALRGYMLAAAAVSGGVWSVSNYLETGKKRFLAGWFIFSFAGVGTMPGTLAGLAAAGLYAAGNCRREIFRKARFYIAAAIPLAAFALFYWPIRKNLLRCAALGEGWHSGTAMLLALAMGIIFTFFPVIVPAILGQIRRRRISLEYLHILIWLLPIPAAYIFKVAPFPRVFFPLFPVLTLLFAGGLQSFQALMRRKRGRKYAEAMLVLIAVGILLWFNLTRIEAFRKYLSSFHPCPGGQEDFIDCHFARSDFSPRLTAQEFKKRFPDIPAVYATFDSDPWALMYAFMENGINTRILFDGPAGRIPGIPPIVIKHFNESSKNIEQRFNCRFQEIFTTENHTFLIPVYE